jgi:CubicO group peptidase (beta-lactamase class C family)
MAGMARTDAGDAADPLRVLVEEAVAAGRIPGAAWHVEDRRGVVSEGRAGRAALVPEERPVSADTLYDLASLTKALAAAPLALLLDRDGALPLDAPLSRRIPELGGGPWEETTARDCLLHRAGLPAWAPLYCLAPSPSEVPGAISRIAPAYPPGEGIVYSCLGPILLGIAMERACDQELADLFEERVVRPIEGRDLAYRPGLTERERTAPTELGNRFERRLAGDAGAGYDGWRAGMIHGQVHDGNAWFLGGAAGNAGLFGSASAVAALGMELLHGPAGLLGEGEREALLRPAAGGETRRALFGSMASNPGSSGSPLSGLAVGHSGFTGTSLWLDPERGAVLALLSNRVHPEAREESDMDGLRRAFHEAAAALLDGRR